MCIGLLERYHIARSDIGHDSCVIVAAKYSTTSGALDKPLLYQALAQLIQTHAALGVYLQGDSSKSPTYHRLQSIDLDQVLTFVDNNDVATAMEQQFLIPWERESSVPLWRLTVLTDNTVLFAFHHSICDGKSGGVFHAALLRALNGPPLPQPSENVSVPQLDLVPPVETVVDLSVSFGRIVREVAGLFIPVSWTKAYTAWTGNPIVSFPHLRNNVRIIYFPPEESRQFLEACRANKSTLSSAYHTIAASAMSRLVTKNGSGSGYKTLPSAIPVCLRNLGHTSPEVLCDHISACNISSPLENTEFSWSTASALATELRSQASSYPANIGILKFLFGNERGYLKGMEGQKRKCAFELSNIGKFSSGPAPEDKWKVSQVVFAQCDAVGGAAIKINVAGDPEGGTSLGITWGEGAVENEFVASFIYEFRKNYFELIGIPKTQ